MSGQSAREENELRILRLLRECPGISRAEIAKRTGLGKATVSTTTARLIEEGVIHEAGVRARKGSIGRRPIDLQLSGSSRLAVGIELTGSEFVIALTDLYVKPLHVVRCPMHSIAVRDAVDSIEGLVRELLAEHDVGRLLGLGVGAPGPVDEAGQSVIQAENIGWSDVPLGTMLQERLDTPVLLIKRNNAGALGEYRYGAGRGKDNLVYVSIDVGIGAGHIVRGSLYDGATGSAGEIGHITMVPDGYRCRCGNSGCLETLASCRALVVRCKERIKEGLNSMLVEWTKGNLELVTHAQILEAAEQGDKLAIEVIQEAARYLGRAISSDINLFNPSLVIIGGDVVRLGDLYFEPLREEVRRRTFSLPLSAVEIVPSALGYCAAAVGAAGLVVDRFFFQENGG